VSAPHRDIVTAAPAHSPAWRRRVLASVFALALLLPPVSPCGPRASGAAPVQLPPVTRVKLKNGLVVLIMPMHRLPLVDLRLVSRAGSIHDPAGREGCAGLTADLLTQGAGSRDAKALAEDIAFVGGSLDASAGAEQMVVTCEVLRKDLATGLELFHDVIALPTFPAEEFARKKEEALGGIASDRDDPSSVADRSMLPFMMGAHPLGHPVSGWEKSVQAITRDDVVAFHHRYLTPENSLLAVVGDVDPQAIAADLEKRFADWQSGGGSVVAATDPIPQFSGRHVRIVRKPEVTQAQIRLSAIGVARNHPDYFPITVANLVLGGGFTSRLVNSIRVEQGLTYSIGSGFRMYRDGGTFVISTFTRNETLRRTIDEVLKSVGALIEQGPSEEELAKAKRYITGQYPLGLQAPDALARQLLDIEFFGLDPRYIETFDEKVNAVSMTDARRALKSYFNIKDLKILVVANPDSASKALAGLGTLDVVDVP
jgi:zinc protease